MSFLVVVSLVWAFSFGLIGKFLPGLPSAWVGWVRLALSALVFLPFVRRVPWKTGLGLFAAGALLPALPLAAVPAGGLEIKYYLCLLWALCALAGLGLSETVAWIEKVAPRAAAGGNKEGRNK